jgi:hypothetical protein
VRAAPELVTEDPRADGRAERSDRHDFAQQGNRFLLGRRVCSPDPPGGGSNNAGARGNASGAKRGRSVSGKR